MKTPSLLASAALLGSLSLMAFTGCGTGSGPNTTSRVRLFDALVGGPAGGISIVQRGMALNASALAYGTAAPSSVNAYYTVVSGGSSITGSGVNTDVYAWPSVSGAALAPEQSFLLSPNTAGQNNGTYTIAAAGITGSTTTPPVLYRFIDNAPALTSTLNVVALRVINLAPDTAGTTGLSLDNNNQPVLGLSNIAYGDPASSASYIQIPILNGIPFQFSITYGSANQKVNTQTPLSNIALVSGHSYTLFLIGEVNPVNGAPGLDYVLTTDN